MADFDPDIGKATQFDSKRASEAGKKSAKTRRFAKDFKAAAMAEMEKRTTLRDGSRINGREAIISSLAREAVKGNVRAAELLIKLCGEQPAEQVELSGKGGKDLFGMMSDAELKEKIQELNEKLGKSG